MLESLLTMSDDLRVLGGAELRKQFWHIATKTNATVVILVHGSPVAIYRPLNTSEAQAVDQASDGTLPPTIPIREIVSFFGRTRQELADNGGQALVYRVLPGGFGSNGDQQSFEEFLGSLSLLSSEQSNALWDMKKIREFSQLRSLTKEKIPTKG